MIQLTDEIINKYIDGELDYDALREVREILNNSGPDRKRFITLQAAHQELSRIKLYEVSPDFTSTIMSKLLKNAKAKREEKYFIFSVSSIFVGISLLIIVYLIVVLIGQSSGTSISNQNINLYIDYFTKNLSSLKEIFTNKNISILGSVFSLGMIVIAYFFYESLRRTKRGLSKLH